MIKALRLKNRGGPVLYEINSYTEPTKQVHKNLLQKLDGQHSPDPAALQLPDSHRNLQLRKLESRLASYMERIHSYLIFMSQISGFQNIPDIDKNAMASGESQSVNTSQIKKHFKSGYQMCDGLLSLMTRQRHRSDSM